MGDKELKEIMIPKKLWLTYSWKDNDDGDVDFLVQSLRGRGLDVHLDRRDIVAGKRLWDQIADAIQNPNKSDGWGFLVSQNSLNSEGCKEELAYALDRALNSRGQEYPLIGIVYGNVDGIIPPALKIRLHVSLKDNDWLDRIYEGVQGKGLGHIPSKHIDPFFFAIHRLDDETFLIEVRPRIGVWAPFITRIPKASLNDFKGLWHGSSGGPQYGGPHVGGILHGQRDYDSPDESYHIYEVSNEASATQSYYLHFTKMPSEIIFGSIKGPQYVWKNANSQ